MHRNSSIYLALALGFALLGGLAPQSEPPASSPEAKPQAVPPIEGDRFTNSLKMDFVRIQAGKFWMGSDADEIGHESDESPQHMQHIEDDFYLGKLEVTQGQWMELMETRPWSGKDRIKNKPDHASVYISWKAATEFCEKLSEKEGRTYRLPTEAEWEYACRAGTETRFSFGDDNKGLNDHGLWEGNAFDRDRRYAHRAGSKSPNPWGLHDMHGNVMEWCSNWFARYQDKPAEETGDVLGDEHKMLRGGSWLSDADDCRSANREIYGPGFESAFIGFRVLLEAGEGSAG